MVTPSRVYNLIACIFFMFLFTSCNSDNTVNEMPPDENGDNNSEEIISEAFPNLAFERPLNITHAGDQSERLFVEEQGGLIHVFENDKETSTTTIFLDISDRITDQGNEQGLLGLAFHPDYESNGYFYVNYTAEGSGRTVVSRFNVSDENPDSADPNSEFEILSISQPRPNHNGGHLAFGPDGYLYISTGDGGGAGDPEENGQDRSTLHGAILRIDVDNPQNGKQYGIPADNPFADNSEGYREEIFAYGLRNPWRFSFDPETGNLWAGDVGQSSREEINLIENGLNYGWNIMEGSTCYQSGDCDKTGLELPIFEYTHSNQNRSITGGYVYRGASLQELDGYYIYADFGSGRIWALNYSDPESPVSSELFDADFPISSFGTDQNNELYFCGFDGKIYHLSRGVLNQL